MSVTPFVVGQWVRGEKFYGRTALIGEILEGPRNWLWVLGTRRIGKTSLLKQIGHLTVSGQQGYFPLFWDFQGAADPKELHLGFHDSLLDTEDNLAELGISLAQVEDKDLFSSLGKLRRQLRPRGRKLLLLCDEVEELINLDQRDPSLLGKFRRALQSAEDIRSVMASTIRLCVLVEQRTDTSPFLHGFTPPLYIHNLTDEEARALIQQINLPDDSRPRIDDRIVESIRASCDNHPYLIQLLCKRFLELTSLEEAVEQVSADPMVSYFFSVDFDMLSSNEKSILHLIMDQDASTSNSIQKQLPMDSSELGTNLLRLEHLGYIHRDAERRFVLANSFFRKWFAARREAPGKTDVSAAAAGPDEAALDATLSMGTSSQVLDGRYDLLERVGQGAQGVVYKAHDRLLRSTVAIKVIRAEYAVSEEALERVRREILLAREIAHPNVVRMYHLGESSGKTYLIMQWIDGETLAKLMSRTGPLPYARAKRIAEGLAGALEAAHSLKVLHRDVKASNILIDAAGEPHLSDFGLARLLEDSSGTSHGIFLGTPDYASPEQANSRPLDERSDLYSLGIVMFEMVAGRRPFIARSVSEVLELHRRAVPPDPIDLRPEVPRSFGWLILSCLEKDPAKRPQSAGELRRSLIAL
jgi:tRNA A-37 threonylcarbamoyl transferase component Bud32